MADQRFPALRPDARQFGIAFDFDAPSLVVGQVPVEGVELVQRQDVDEPFDILHGVEIARHVEHRPAVAEMGFVADLHDGNPVAVDELAQGLHAVKHRPGRSAADRHAFLRCAQRVLLAGERAVQLEVDAFVYGFVLYDGFPHTLFGQVTGAQRSDGLQRGGVVTDSAAAVEAERAVALLH